MYTVRRMWRYLFAGAGLCVLALSIVFPSIRIKGTTISLEGKDVAHADVPSCESCSSCSSCASCTSDSGCADSGCADSGCAGSPGE